MKNSLTILLSTVLLSLSLFVTSEVNGKSEAYHRDRVDTPEEIRNHEPATVKHVTVEDTDDGCFVRLGRESQSSESDMLLPMDTGLLDESEGEERIQSIEEQVKEAYTSGLI